MKKTYEKPFIEIFELEIQDIIMFSVFTDGDDADVGWDDFDVFDGITDVF